MKRFLSFMVTGSLGFVVDVSVLLALIDFVHMDAFSARIVAIASALSCTWLLNRRFTFDRSSHSLVMEGGRYWSIGALSACVNFAVYTLLLLVARLMPPFVALAVSSACGALVSYNGYVRFAFLEHPRER